MSVRVRFAPSPTGFLHIGGARTALFNWLFARSQGGTFILRIEDTDEERNSPEAIAALIDGLRWLGLDWDEGPTTQDPDGPSTGDRGPYFQSRRSEIYQKHIDSLLSRDLAYERDGAIRFRMRREAITIPDVIVGDVRRELTDREEKDPDFVIVRSDGKPVFHLVNVIDDLEMGMTHVIRGEDHLSNTSRHIALYEALGAETPKFAHIPLILNANGSKMSKRDEGASLTAYMENGFIPEAAANYLALLGWSPKDDQEIFALRELIERFDLNQVNRSNAKFDGQKMKWVNAQRLKDVDPAVLVAGCEPFLKACGFPVDQFAADYRERAMESCREKLKTYADITEFAGFYFAQEVDLDPDVAKKPLASKFLPALEGIREAFGSLETFDEASLEAAVVRVAESMELKPAPWASRCD